MGPPLGNYHVSDYMPVLLTVILGGGLPLFMYTCGLDSEVRNCGVCIRFHPFHRKWVVFEFESIQKVDYLTYRPIRDYGGWGIRYGRTGKAYNVSGNKGVLLTLRDGKSVLIGSQNHEALCSAINESL